MSRRSVADARAALARPYAAEHDRSVARQAAMPRGLPGLLEWFLIGIREELPEDIHAGGVWRDYVRVDEDRKAEGGSLLGSPALTDGFRSFIEGSAFAVESSEYEGHLSRDGDEHYRTPMRAAIARLNGRHFCGAIERRVPGHECPQDATLARLLYRIACRDGDWFAAGLEFAQPSLVRLVVESALVRLWRRYSAVPPARPLQGEASAA